MSETEKKRRRLVHGLLVNVSTYSQTHAGAYINLNSFKATGKSQIEFDLKVSFNGLLAYQAFDLFPNGIIGDYSIRFQVSPAGQTYTVAEAKVFLEDNDNVSPEELEKLKLIKAHGHLKLQFTQIGNEALIPGPSTAPSPIPSPSPTPDPTPTLTPIQYKLKYRIGERWEYKDDGS